MSEIHKVPTQKLESKISVHGSETRRVPGMQKHQEQKFKAYPRIEEKLTERRATSRQSTGTGSFRKPYTS